MSAEEELRNPQEELPIDDEPIQDDLQCFRCGGNIRGLKPSDNCPACGAQVAKALALATEQMLCPVCAAPNHPSLPLCGKCGSPMSGAAGIAGYYQTLPSAPRRASEQEDEEEDDVPGKPPSLTLVIVGWILGLPPLLAILAFVLYDWLDALNSYSATLTSLAGHAFGSILGLGLGGLIPALIIILPTRTYLRKKHAYWRASQSRATAASNAPTESSVPKP